MKNRRLFALPLIMMIGASCEDSGKSPKLPEIDGNAPHRSDISSSDPSIPRIEQGTIIDPVIYPEGDEVYPGDDLFNICYVLEEESDRCDSYIELEG